MATTDTRSGFRLPWSSDRSHDAPAPEAAETPADEPVAEAPDPVPPAVEWPSSDFNARLGLHSQPRPADAADAVPELAEEPEMILAEPAPPVAPPPPRKPSKLMAELSAAIRATAEAAREQALAQVEADVAAVIEQIRAGAKDGEDALRARSDEDIAGIKEWSRAEIARIKEETEHRIAARKLGLDEELAAHAAAIEQRVGKVEGTAAAYRTEIEAYASRLTDEDDPARLATMAESMPDAPALEALADLGDLELDLADPTLAVAVPPEEPEASAVVEAALEADASVAVDAQAPAELVDEAGAAEPGVDPEAGPAEAVVDPEAGPAEAVDPEAGAAEAVVDPEAGADALMTDPEADAAEPTADPADAGAGTPWVDPDNAWVPASTGTDEVALEDDGSSAEPWSDGVPRWAAGDTPEGFPAADAEAGDPVDRGAIMAALEAAAEAVVAAESAAESADQAEAAADVAETAAELLKGRVDDDHEYDPEAAAALSARVGAGGFEESYTDRLASLLPGHAEGAADGEPRSTQVIVSGLVSVASIASFKRHLGRLAGVQAVAVASGPEGEFVFNVAHRPDVSFRDAVPTLPGFAARVTGTADGVVHVSARDPEAEG